MARAVPLHVRILDQLDAIKRECLFGLLTADEERVFDHLILKWSKNGTAKLSEVMDERHFGSRTTVYRKICGLRSKKFVRFTSDKKDKRIKSIAPDSKAIEYIRKVRYNLSYMQSVAGRSPKIPGGEQGTDVSYHGSSTE